mgnify:FL=1
MLRGDHRSHGHIDVLPMRIRSAVQHIGHDCLDIAAGVRIHNLSVRTGRTMPSSPFLVLFFVATTLTLAHTAPDTETLIMVDGPISDTVTDFTLGANPLRIPGGTAFFREECFGIGLRAQRFVLPRHVIIPLEQTPQFSKRILRRLISHAPHESSHNCVRTFYAHTFTPLQITHTQCNFVKFPRVNAYISENPC